MVDASLVEGDRRPRLIADGTWVRVAHEDVRRPAQGWKIHVSATVQSAEHVLGKVLPVLMALRADFKVVAFSEVLASVNSNETALSQVGKFLTVYPRDDQHSVAVGRALARATEGMPGPVVPSDRLIAAGSPIFYRYGAFRPCHVQTPTGAIVPAVRDPTGTLVPDRREASYYAPPWIRDPFVAAGLAAPVASPLPAPPGYAVQEVVQESPRGAVYRALASDTRGVCVLKRARRHALADDHGRDARDRLAHEADVLTRLAPDRRFPRVLELFEHDDDLFLALQDVGRPTLGTHVTATVRAGGRVATELVKAWGVELARLLQRMHESGLVYRDLKPSNIVLGAKGLALVDFEVAFVTGAAEPPFGRGTAGYFPPDAGASAPQPADDLFALGAVLWFALTGARPHRLASAPALRKLLWLLRPDLDEQTVAVTVRLLDVRPIYRPTCREAVAALSRPLEYRTYAPHFGDAVEGQGGRGHFLALAGRLAETLTVAPGDRAGAPPGQLQDLGDGRRRRDIDQGAAGLVLALAEAVDQIGAVGDVETLAAAGHWLASSRPLDGPVVTGLYAGEAGVAAALLRAGQVLDDSSLVDAARRRSRALRTLKGSSPNLFDGTAGRLRLHLLLFDHTGEAEELAAARAAADALFARFDHGGAGWVMPDDYGVHGGAAFLGYGRGWAGIADALLDLTEVTGDERGIEVALAVRRRLSSLAVPVPGDGYGVNWPVTPGGPLFGAFWCHGATGIAQFMFRLDRLSGGDDLPLRAAHTVAEGTRWAGPGQCHGLAGCIELLLDAWRATGDARWRAKASELASILTFHVTDLTMSPTPRDGAAPPSGYSFGTAGLVLCLLRLAQAGKAPRQLTLEGFRHRATGPG